MAYKKTMDYILNPYAIYMQSDKSHN